jgi:hypothetical protein
VGSIDLAPLLIEQLANTACLDRDLLQAVEAVEQEIAQVGHVYLSLYPQVGDPSSLGCSVRSQRLPPELEVLSAQLSRDVA